MALLLDPCRAAAGPVLTLGENGQRASSGGAGPLVFSVAVDSISGVATMGFFVGDALGIVNPTQGDVIIREPGGSAISDLLRFQNTKPGFGGVLLVFSDLDGGVDSGVPGNPPLTADVGIPTPQAGAITRDEMDLGNGMSGLIYTPQLLGTGAPEPGWIPGGVTYIFISDVPEPNTLLLAGGGSLAILSWLTRWPAHKKSSAVSSRAFSFQRAGAVNDSPR
jgi:hypothetical protein